MVFALSYLNNSDKFVKEDVNMVQGSLLFLGSEFTPSHAILCHRNSPIVDTPGFGFRLEGFWTCFVAVVDGGVRYIRDIFFSHAEVFCTIYIAHQNIEVKSD